MTTQLRLAIIIGSTRIGRFGDTPATWFARQAKADGTFEVDVIDLADYDLPYRMNREESESTQELRRRIDDADAYVIVTPEYNHSYPGSLKNVIDQFNSEWAGKAVGLISYGGNAGGQRAVEHLRQVFAELRSMTVRNTIPFTNFWDAFDDEGEPKDAEGTAIAAKGLLEQLHWWAAPLKSARDAG